MMSPDRDDAHHSLTRLSEISAELSFGEVEELAIKIRSAALSGYTWNVPERWADAADAAREVWRGKARHQLAMHRWLAERANK